MADALTPEQFFAGHPHAMAVFTQGCTMLDQQGTYQVHVSKSQVAFRRRRGLAYLWVPGHPAAAHWMHHLEVHHLSDLDDEVAAWLTEAAEAADRVTRCD